MHRPLAPGLIQGAIRGLLAGALTAAVLSAPFVFVRGSGSTIIALAVAATIVSTVLGASDGLEARLGPRASVRALAPMLGGSLAATVLVSVSNLVLGRQDLGLPTDAVVASAVYGFLAGIPLGAASVAAGAQPRGASVRQKYRRAAVVGEGLALLPATGLLVSMMDRRAWWELGAIALVLFLVPLVHCTSHLVVRSIGRSVGQWLEEHSWTSRVEARDEYGKLAADAARLRRLAESAEDAKARLSATERGLEAARSAFDVAESARLELVREEAARQLRYFLRALGREEEARSLKA